MALSVLMLRLRFRFTLRGFITLDMLMALIVLVLRLTLRRFVTLDVLVTLNVLMLRLLFGRRLLLLRLRLRRSRLLWLG